MSNNKSDREKADKYLANKGYEPLQNSTGMSNGSTTVKPSDSGQSWITNKGDHFSTLSDLKKSKKV